MATNRYPDEGMPKMPPFKAPNWLIPFFIVILLFSSASTLFYEVGPDEVGVVQRFGKYLRTTNPGLHMKMPFGIETVKNIKVTHVFKEEFGFRTVMAGTRSLYAGRDDEGIIMRKRSFQASGGDPFLEESLMLTGDLNVAIVEWIVQYTIKDPVAFAFRVRDPRETIRNMSEAMMRLVIGDHTINQVLTAGREKIQTEVEKKLQEVLDSYGAGIARALRCAM
jgi:modulator of FtsH protease HflK